MRYLIKSMVLYLCMGFASVCAAASLQSYELSSSTRQSHLQFYAQLANRQENETTLNNLRIVFVVDRSGSQGGPDKALLSEFNLSKGMVSDEYWSQWDTTFQIVKLLSDDMFRYAKNKTIPLIFFGNDASAIIETDSTAKLLAAFQKKEVLPNSDATNMLAGMRVAFTNYIGSKDNVLFIVFTDGCPDLPFSNKTDAELQSDIRYLIYDTIAAEDPKGSRLNVLFVQIGSDQQARAFLNGLSRDKDLARNVTRKSARAAAELGTKRLILLAINKRLDGEDKDQYWDLD